MLVDKANILICSSQMKLSTVLSSWRKWNSTILVPASCCMSKREIP